jgi:hypothetical protein
MRIRLKNFRNASVKTTFYFFYMFFSYPVFFLYFVNAIKMILR